MNGAGKIKELFRFDGYNLIDLSYTFEVGMPAWPTHPHYSREVVEEYENDSFFNKITFCEHNGTHMDAPLHFIPGAVGIDALDYTKFFGRALIVDPEWARKVHEGRFADLKPFHREALGTLV